MFQSRRLRHLSVLALFSTLLAIVVSPARTKAQAPAYTGGLQARQLVVAPVIETDRVILHGNTRPEAIAANDRGALAPALQLNGMQLLLKRPAELEQQLVALAADQQDKKSPSFHKWLTAAQFGQRFGANPQDIARVTEWLQSHGLHVDSVQPNGMVIVFSGNVAEVESTFHTSLHTLQVNGVKHFANMSDPQIPTALAEVVAGPTSLHNFRPHTNFKKRVRPRFTTTYQGQPLEEVVPSDLATIYNLDPAFAAGITGAGQSVVVIEDTDVYSTDDIADFRSLFGLSGYKGTFTQVNPGGCDDPGVVDGNESEAELDAEWAGASAPDAAIILASCSDTETTFGGLIAMQNYLNSANPPVIYSVSYGECEAYNGATANQSYSDTYQQGAMEGASIFVSAGDEGAASCDANQGKATHGIGVNAFASTPYNVAVGGTDFGDTFLGEVGTYWNSTNSATYGSAKSYIPEIPWNDSCASQLLYISSGYSTATGTSGFCNSTIGESEFLSTASGSGGPSGCYSGTPSIGGVVSTGCVGQPKPSWQSVMGNPSDGVRDIPDVSLFAANGVWNHFYVYCDTDEFDAGSASCTADDVNQGNLSGAGGTSFSSPIMAGVQALINQNYGGPQGNPAPRLYALAAMEYGTTGNSACNSALGNSTSSSCIFYDTTIGDIDVNCTGTHNCYNNGGANGTLSTSNTMSQAAYNTTQGWDFATGLGSINIYNLVKNWNSVATTTTASIGSSSENPGVGGSVTFTATVAAGVGPTVTGYVNWSSNTGCGTTALNGTATCTTTTLAAGSDTVTAYYAGDGTYTSSSGTYTQSVGPTKLAFTSAPSTPITAGGNAGTVQVTIEDAGNNPDFVAGDIVTLTVTGPNSYSQQYTSTTHGGGVATFILSSVAIDTAGTYTYTATDQSLTQAQATETVTPGMETAFIVTGIPSPAVPAVAYTFTVTAVDSYGNTVTGANGSAPFTQTVSIASTDSTAILNPATYNYTASDAGTHNFQVTFNTAGIQSVTAIGAVDLGSESNIQVGDLIAVLSTSNQLTRLSQAGTLIDQFNGQAIGRSGLSVDALGKYWTIVPDHLDAFGPPTSNYGNGVGFNNASALAIDGFDHVWVANGNATVVVSNDMDETLDPHTGYQTNSGVTGATAIAIDNSGSVWVTNGDTVTKFFGAAAPVAPIANSVTNVKLGTRP